MLFPSRRPCPRSLIRGSHYSNPYFSPSPKSKKNSKFFYNLLVLTLTAGAWAYFLFASSVFRIDNLEINGLRQYAYADVASSINNYLNRERKFLVFNSSNIFLVDENALKKGLSKQFVFDKIKIEKIYPHKIILNIVEKEKKIALYNGNSIFYLASDGTVIGKEQGVDSWLDEAKTDNNEDGTPGVSKINMEIIFSDAAKREISSYAIFCDAYNLPKNLEIGDAYPGQKSLLIIQTFIDSVQKQTALKIKLAAIEKNGSNEKITLYADNGWKIYLNGTDDGLKQYYKFYAALTGKIKDMNKALEYIDLRFGDMVYIK